MDDFAKFWTRWRGVDVPGGPVGACAACVPRGGGGRSWASPPPRPSTSLPAGGGGVRDARRPPESSVSPLVLRSMEQAWRTSTRSTRRSSASPAPPRRAAASSCGARRPADRRRALGGLAGPHPGGAPRGRAVDAGDVLDGGARRRHPRRGTRVRRLDEPPALSKLRARSVGCASPGRPEAAVAARAEVDRNAALAKGMLDVVGGGGPAIFAGLAMLGAAMRRN